MFYIEGTCPICGTGTRGFRLCSNNASVVVMCDETMRIEFDRIVGFEMPASVASATGLRLRTTDGIRFVRMAGSYGPDNKFKDVFSLTRVLHVLTRRGAPW